MLGTWKRNGAHQLFNNEGQKKQATHHLQQLRVKQQYS